MIIVGRLSGSFRKPAIIVIERERQRGRGRERGREGGRERGSMGRSVGGRECPDSRRDVLFHHITNHHVLLSVTAGC